MMPPKLLGPDGHPLLDAEAHALATGSDVSIVRADGSMLADSMSTMQTQPVSEDTALDITVPHAALLGDSMSTMQTQADAAPDAATLLPQDGLPHHGLSPLQTELDSAGDATVVVPSGHLLRDSMSTMQTQPTD